MSDLHLSALLALLAALLFGVGAQLTRLGLRSLDAQNGAFISIAAAALMYWMVAPWELEAAFIGSTAMWLFIAVGIFRPALSSTFALAGTAILGPTISTTLSSTAPFFGLLFGVLVLDEPLTLTVGSGTFLIIAGVVLLAWRRSSAQTLSWPLWALLLPLLAAVIRVAAHLATKLGMEEVPSPYFAGLVAYNASLAVSLVNFVRRGQRFSVVMRAPGARWFIVTGVLFGCAILSLNHALLFGPLSVVAPLVALETLVVLILGVTVFGEASINRRVGLAALMVVAGAVLITSRS